MPDRSLLGEPPDPELGHFGPAVAGCPGDDGDRPSEDCRGDHVRRDGPGRERDQGNHEADDYAGRGVDAGQDVGGEVVHDLDLLRRNGDEWDGDARTQRGGEGEGQPAGDAHEGSTVDITGGTVADVGADHDSDRGHPDRPRQPRRPGGVRELGSAGHPDQDA